VTDLNNETTGNICLDVPSSSCLRRTLLRRIHQTLSILFFGAAIPMLLGDYSRAQSTLDADDRDPSGWEVAQLD
jgi:hypothetical protein